MVDHTTVCIVVNYRWGTDSTWYMDSPSDFQRKTVSSKVSRCFAWQQSETLLTSHCCFIQHDPCCFHLSHIIHNSSIIIPYYPMSKIQNASCASQQRIPTSSSILRIPTRNKSSPDPIPWQNVGGFWCRNRSNWPMAVQNLPSRVHWDVAIPSAPLSQCVPPRGETHYIEKRAVVPTCRAHCGPV